MNEIAAHDEIARIPIGGYVPMVDGPEKVSGRAKYTADFIAAADAGGAHLPQPLCACGDHRGRHLGGRRSCRACWRSSPAPTATRTFGVLPIARNEYPLARDKVRYKGEPVAAVAAIDEATAEKAIRLIRMQVRELPAYFTAAAALAPDAVQLHEKKPGNLERDVLFELGNVADGFAEADLVREATYNCAEVCQNQMEMHAAVADYDARARPPHRARLHAGALLRAPDAGADPRHGHVAHPRGQAVRRRRLRLPHRDASTSS